MNYISLFLILALSCVLINGQCFGERTPETVGLTTMSMCCWYHESTCCAFGGIAADLSDFQLALDKLHDEGISETCYIELANVMCSFCTNSPDDYITFTGLLANDEDDDVGFGDRGYTMRICLDFAKVLLDACGTAGDRAILGANPNTNDATNFVESIDTSSLVNNEDSVSGLFNQMVLRVSTFDCFRGVGVASIVEQERVCLTPFVDQGIVNPDLSPLSPSSNASIVSFSFALLLLSLVFLF
eukprot:TRINITY_DN20259_c0_g1_i2.p1 TRINITY_DN20259_c0_g1~~TRINITY_DN20259_c0_g1_i2.p1  ORF type:complete len:283 (-),score=37.93 TRINITY_DN20259_c0_g1_i2:149-877(-)